MNKPPAFFGGFFFLLHPCYYMTQPEPGEVNLNILFFTGTPGNKQFVEIRDELTMEGYIVSTIWRNAELKADEIKKNNIIFIEYSFFTSVNLQVTEVLSNLRSITLDIPIIILAPIFYETKEAEALLSGANDYLVPPFNSNRLKLKMGVVLDKFPRISEKKNINHPEIIVVDKVAISMTSQEVWMNGIKVHTSLSLYLILAFLAKRKGVLTTSQDLTQYFKAYISETNKCINGWTDPPVLISRLRKLMSKHLDREYIISPKGVRGYVFE